MAPKLNAADLERGLSSESLTSPAWSRMQSPMDMMSYNAKTFEGLPQKPASAALSGASILGLWALFVLNRAVHPLVIDYSKGPDGKLPYSKLSPVIAKCVLSVLVCNAFALFSKKGWREGLRECYNPEAFRVFGTIGIFYAMGDYLEMSSMASMSGAAYQVLLQSKLMITAVMMWLIKGRSARQTAAQWSVLVTVTLGMCLFMLIQAGSSGSGASQASGLGGVGFALMKVCVSCFSAVKADQSLKQFKSLPLYAQLSQLMGSWGLASLAMSAFLSPATVASPAAFFRGWDVATILVVCSFAAKTVLTMTLLKVLDSVQKNIGEAVAVVVIYFSQVLLPVFPTHFELNTFMAMLVVVMAVTTYMLLKKQPKAAEVVPLKEVPEEAEVSHFVSPDAKRMPRRGGAPSAA